MSSRAGCTFKCAGHGAVGIQTVLECGAASGVDEAKLGALDRDVFEGRIGSGAAEIEQLASEVAVFADGEAYLYVATARKGFPLLLPRRFGDEGLGEVVFCLSGDGRADDEGKRNDGRENEAKKATRN